MRTLFCTSTLLEEPLSPATQPVGADPKSQERERRREPCSSSETLAHGRHLVMVPSASSSPVASCCTSPKVENPGKSCRVQAFSSQKTVQSHTQFPYAGMMNFQLTSQQRLFIFKEECSISEGVPAGKVFTTWGVHRDWERQVGLGPHRGSVCVSGAVRSFPYRGDWRPLRPPDITRIFSVWAEGGT